MRLRILFISFCLFLILGVSAFGQFATDVAAIEDAFQTFTNDFATTLPALSTVGLNWSDAYIGGFPHFGAGATLGVAMIPYTSMTDAAAIFGVSLDELIPPELRGYGLPLPMWCVDGRLGGFVLPFDVGFKIGFLPPDVDLPANLTFDFMLVGADFRYGILEDLGPIPDLSVGIGINWLSGAIGFKDAIPDGTIDITDYGANAQLVLDAGDFNYNWQALTVDLKAQVSKNLVFITLSAGFGATYSLYAEAGGGIEAAVLIDEDSTDGNPPVALTPAQIAQIQSYYSGLDLSGAQFIITGSANGWSFRAFGGLQFDLLIFKIDLNLNYNFISSSWGGTLNLRAQL
ncbi:MAG: hypothetical protein JW904_09280 [Spirochaetales bacterium]|nr:hypothetical protein [Spirochaetales bacterium]